jgi:Putative Actinobacterial Holin-X, holin superfamily III
MDAWLAALIVGVVLLAVAGILALLGRRQVQQATPPLPTEAVEGLKQDIQTVKERRH